MQLKTSAIILTAVAFSAAALAAHQYDTSQMKTLSGNVTKVEWNNKDYVKIHMNAMGDNGKTADWELQTVPKSTFQSDGASMSNLKDGDQITVQGYPASNGSPHMLVSSITLANGQNLAVNAQEQNGPTASATINNQQSNAPTSASTDQQPLPQTASDVPLIGLIGLVALGAGSLLALRRRVS